MTETIEFELSKPSKCRLVTQELTVPVANAYHQATRALRDLNDAIDELQRLEAGMQILTVLAMSRRAVESWENWPVNDPTRDLSRVEG